MQWKANNIQFCFYDDSFPFTSFQDDKDLVHEFVVEEGLTCLIKVGAEADQNYQNYILRGTSAPQLFTSELAAYFFLLSAFSHLDLQHGLIEDVIHQSCHTFSFHKPIQDHMCLHTACKLMTLPADPLTLTHLQLINRVQCVPQIMWKSGQVEQLVNLSAP